MTEPLDTVESSGFSILHRVFETPEIHRALSALGEGDRHRPRAGLRGLLGNPLVASVAHDPRLLEIARVVVGDAAVPFRATLFDKSLETNWLVAWHQDTALPIRERRDVSGWGPWSVKAGVVHAHAPAQALASIVALRVHLDDSDASNGPLRVLPGTHRLGVLSDAELAQLSRKSRMEECLVPLGGILVMRPLLVHASSKAVAKSPRRVLQLEYAPALDLGDGLQLALA